MLRREFFRVAAASACGATILRGGRAEPVAVQVGDVLPGRGVVWMRSAQPGQMTVRWRTTEKAEGNVRTVRGPMLSAATDFTGRVELRGVAAGQRIFYEAQVEGGAPVEGSFRTAPESGGEVRFLWSGDMVGQGWGINPAIGGIRIFETMRRLEPHFFIHSGDTIYADGPIQAEVKLPGGAIWKNLVTEEKGKAAESLDEFRGAYRYNLLDENVRRFTSEIPQVWQWDDHEVLNNWSPGKDLGSDGKYQEKNVQVLVSRARRAFLEYAPIRLAGSRIHRKIAYGPLLDLFVLDMRSYRAANSWNRQPAPSPETAFLGAAQINWLKHDLRRSKATWKVIAADMPIALLVSDGKDRQGRPMFEASANGNGPALGRELEIADLLCDMKRHNVRNTIWLTADVHYTAAHYFDPAKAQFTDFLPFWEFVSGPLNAGTFGPGILDNTFGPEVMFAKAPPPGRSNLSPLEGMQFFGDVRISGKTGQLTVVLRDLAGTALYSKTLSPERG